MRLEHCPSCLGATSPNAKECVKCGEPLSSGWIEQGRSAKTAKRKKRIEILSTMILGFIVLPLSAPILTNIIGQAVLWIFLAGMIVFIVRVFIPFPIVLAQYRSTAFLLSAGFFIAIIMSASVIPQSPLIRPVASTPGSETQAQSVSHATGSGQEQETVPATTGPTGVTSEGQRMQFEACLENIRRVSSQLGVAPINITETGILRIVRFPTDDGAVLVTCSRLDQKMIITRSSN